MVVGNRYLKCNHFIEIVNFDEEDEIIRTYIQPITIDLFRIEAYERSFEEEEGKRNLYTDIITHSGHAICIDVDYATFDKIFEKHVINAQRSIFNQN